MFVSERKTQEKRRVYSMANGPWMILRQNQKAFYMRPLPFNRKTCTHRAQCMKTKMKEYENNRQQKHTKIRMYLTQWSDRRCCCRKEPLCVQLNTCRFEYMCIRNNMPMHRARARAATTKSVFVSPQKIGILSVDVLLLSLFILCRFYIWMGAWVRRASTGEQQLLLLMVTYRCRSSCRYCLVLGAVLHLRFIVICCCCCCFRDYSFFQSTHTCITLCFYHSLRMLRSLIYQVRWVCVPCMCVMLVCTERSLCALQCSMCECIYATYGLSYFVRPTCIRRLLTNNDRSTHSLAQK